MTVKRWVASAVAVIVVGLGVWGVMAWSSRDAVWDNCVELGREYFGLEETVPMAEWCARARDENPGEFAEAFSDRERILRELEG